VRNVLLALAGLFAATAAAQTAAPPLDLENLYLDPAGLGALTVGSGETLKSTKFRVGAALGYTYGQLQFDTAKAEGQIILRDRVNLQVYGAVGITDWLEVGATIPVIIHQWFAQQPFDTSEAGLGTPWLHLKFGLLDAKRPIFLSLGISAGLPLGTPQNALVTQGFQVVPRLNLGHKFGAFTLSGELSALIKTRGQDANTDLSQFGGSYWDQVGNNLFAALAATTNGEVARGELSVRFIAPLQPGWVGVEGLLGLRVNIKMAELFIALGPGFGGHPNTPSFRLYGGASFGNNRTLEPPAPVCVEGQPYDIATCPDLDRDGDGIKNALDRCPTEPEDKDGFQDTDGCPDPDNDGDGIADAQDKCPNVKGPKENQGCPDVDTDGDGIVDRLDKCPDQPEDLDGFQDDDGCPDPDNDGDGVVDVADMCPNEPGIPEEKGCPAKDDDGDGVPNHLDNCPTVKGPPENQGCPVKEKQLVVITQQQLKILEMVQFQTGKATILPVSNKLLTNVANVINAQKRIKLVEVAGHTDNVGDPVKNQKLSQDRATAVKAFLLKKGVLEGRLRAVGYGQDKPLESNTSSKGREANRRVEFNIVEQD
jgi:outer membrane protein OmpA-like peptidoglycan-associated protein